MAERPLLRAGDFRGRTRGLRAVHRQATAARHASRRSRAGDEYLGGVQLRGHRRRRVGRLVVRHGQASKRRPPPTVPRLRRSLPLPRLGSRVHRVAEPDRPRRGLPLRRRPRGGCERRRARAPLRPCRLPGHEEYVTRHVYDVIERYRNDGGNLAFLAANNLYRRVDRVGQKLVRRGLWRKLSRPESGIVGVQYVGSDHGQRQAGYTVTGAVSAPWAFAGTGLSDGGVFGRYGIEIDARTAASPRGIQVLAHIPDLLGPGRSAEMTYYETPSGAKVFAAGALNFGASLGSPEVDRLLANVWARLTVP